MSTIGRARARKWRRCAPCCASAPRSATIQIRTLRRTRDLYREGLLVQSEASFKAALAQYQARAAAPSSGPWRPSTAGWATRAAFLQTLAQLQAQHIALREAALGPTVPHHWRVARLRQLLRRRFRMPTVPNASAKGPGQAQDSGPASTKM